MRSLNILQTCFSRSWGGLEMQALDVAQQLRKRSHNVWLAAPPASHLEEEARSAGIETFAPDVAGYFHPSAIFQVARFLREHRIDLIHSHYSKDLATLSPAVRLLRSHVPLILSKRMGSAISKKDLLHRFAYARVDRVLAISSVIRQNVIDTTPMQPERVILLHDAVDTVRFSPASADRICSRRALGLDSQELVVGCVGRFSQGKGHEELLQAARILADRGNRFRLLIVGKASYGEKEYEEKIRAMSRQLALEKVVVFIGFQRDVPGVLSALDVFAFPSHAEAFGVALIEAMAMERAVVATNSDGVLDIVVDRESGLTVNPRNPGELAAAIESLLGDERMRLTLGAAGRRRVLEMFDQQKQIDRLEGIYEELAGRGS